MAHTPPEDLAGSPWGPVYTLVWTAGISLAAIGASTVGSLAWTAVQDRWGQAAAGAMNSPAIAAGIIASCPAVVLLCRLLARARRPFPLHAYLGLRWVGLGTLVRWLAAALVIVLGMDLINLALDRPLVPDFSLQLAAGTPHGWWPLIALATVVCAPLAEESLFRGFAFTGLAQSRLGGPGAVAVTALIWTLVHFQYNLADLAAVLFLGVLMGLCRLWTGSTRLCFAIHAACNLYATVQAFALA